MKFLFDFGQKIYICFFAFLNISYVVFGTIHCADWLKHTSVCNISFCFRSVIADIEHNISNYYDINQFPKTSTLWEEWSRLKINYKLKMYNNKLLLNIKLLRHTSMGGLGPLVPLDEMRMFSSNMPPLPRVMCNIILYINGCSHQWFFSPDLAYLSPSFLVLVVCRKHLLRTFFLFNLFYFFGRNKKIWGSNLISGEIQAFLTLKLSSKRNVGQ